MTFPCMWLSFICSALNDDINHIIAAFRERYFCLLPALRHFPLFLHPVDDVQHIFPANICCCSLSIRSPISSCNDDHHMMFDVLIELLFRVSIFIAFFTHSRRQLPSHRNRYGNWIHFNYSFNGFRSEEKKCSLVEIWMGTFSINQNLIA